jgi:membrane protease YdiL (CAAX protease family)
VERGSGARLLILIGLALALSVASAGLFKAALEAALPGPPWLQKLLRYEAAGPEDTAGQQPGDGTAGSYDLGRASRRYLLLVAVVVFAAARRCLPWAAARRRAFRKVADRWRLVCWGLAMAGGMVLAYLVLIVATGFARWQVPGVGSLSSRVVEYAALAVAVALIEELFFRGLMFRAMLRDWGVAAALTGSSLVYAVVHCISGGMRSGFGWEPWVGARLLAVYFTDGGGSLWPDLRLVVGLFLLGWLLAYLYLRTGSVWVSVGLHGGIVFLSKLMKKVLERADDFPEWLLGDSLFIVSGVACWALVLAAMAVAVRLAPDGPLYRRLRRQSRR